MPIRRERNYIGRISMRLPVVEKQKYLSRKEKKLKKNLLLVVLQVKRDIYLLQFFYLNIFVWLMYNTICSYTTFNIILLT